MKILKLILFVFSLALGNATNAQTLNHSQIKLFRFGDLENEKPAVEYPDGIRLDVSAFGEDYNEVFFAKNGVARLQSWLQENLQRLAGWYRNQLRQLRLAV